tara:strand:+ start:67 stop:432 length:366 start_codon:yes stop_codon:yes gene_type:complete
MKIEQHLWNKLHPARAGIKKSQRSTGIKFTRDEFNNWVKKNYDNKCFYCEISLDEYQEKKLYEKFKLQAKKFGIDRKNSQLGYSLDNIAISCTICNTVKSFLFDAEEFKIIAKKYIKKLYE